MAESSSTRGVERQFRGLAGLQAKALLLLEGEQKRWSVTNIRQRPGITNKGESRRTMVGLWNDLPWIRCHHFSILIPSKPEIICCLFEARLDVDDVGFYTNMLFKITGF